MQDDIDFDIFWSGMATIPFPKEFPKSRRKSNILDAHFHV